MGGRLVGILLSALLAATAHAESALHELRVGEQPRNYRLFVPATGAAPLPLMIVLHGGLGNAEQAEKSTGMSLVAASQGFMVAYPNGTGTRLLPNRRTWNAGNCCGPAQREGVDDVGYISAMLEDIARRAPLDPSRVYVTGMSNGAMLAYRLACELPQSIAAIVPVAGTLALDDCAATSDIALLHIHGSADSHVPYQGGIGENALAGVAHRSVPETLQMFASARRCSGETIESALPDGSRLSVWNCPGKAPLHLRLVPGGEHVWPGGEGRRNRKLFGGNFSASQVAWDFVKPFARDF